MLSRWRRPEPGKANEVAAKRVLIICSGNSARSQIAEGLIRHEAGDLYEVYSAGTNPAEVRTEAIQVMRELRIDISKRRSKPLEEFAGQVLDFVITVWDRAPEVCPNFPGNPVKLHWPFDDPAEVTGVGEWRLIAFRELRDRLHARIMFFLGEGAYGSRDPSAACSPWKG